ncbi:MULTISPECIES: radical SAM/CxCxxxxC motif protein YfkAB [Bacillus]|uniref:radical SAM/CxCxxxxC motif protein YfkAB n=1 Tax=Bacillus TaxID=1386 RepID=UPI0003145E08|nr:MULTISPECIES: radical SAM/CxCxxxxC motif protein YfkAB [Bacillus]
MMNKNKLSAITPINDPWEAYNDITQFGKPMLTNIEFTTTNLCNMRCEHCAVGYTLSNKDANALPLDLLIQRLDEVEHLKALSITGGEPMLSTKSVKNYVVPLLKYAHERGVRTQMNSNLTVELSKYDDVIPYLDVLHISHNWGTIDQFIDNGFAMMDKKPTRQQRGKLFDRMIENSRELVKQGVFVSAETMINNRTLPYLENIHKQIVEEMCCQRHEVHPMYPSRYIHPHEKEKLEGDSKYSSVYPSDFASTIQPVSLEEIRKAILHLLEIRHEDVWMLFGTLPFYPCSNEPADIELLQKLYQAKNVTVRNDPDGRSRLNINIFNGDVIVTDFGDAPPLGNVRTDTLYQAYENWNNTSLAQTLNCHCPSVKCLGPNVLVKNSYYPDIDFKVRTANSSLKI